MKRRLTIFLVALGVFSLTLRADETRYDDVVYLDEAHAKPLPLKTTRRVALAESRDQSNVLLHLDPGQTVWVRGFGPGWDYVQASVFAGSTRGWVDADALEDAPEIVRSEIERLVLTAHRQRNLIAKHEIEVGMTRSQVQAALGKPDEKLRTGGSDSVEEQWTYRTYKDVPQHDSFNVEGRQFDRVYYKKALVSGKTITFRYETVVDIKEEGPSSARSNPDIIPPP